MSEVSSSVTSSPVRLTGRVKWFNNKTGFGFISVVGGNDQFKDASEVFVHHTAVTVSQEQYRYLVEGEYVEFSVVTNDSGEHKFQAGDVRGVKGGKLFCETRHEHRGTTSGKRVGEHLDNHDEYQGRSGYSNRGRGRGGSVRGGRGSSEWMLVRRDQQERRVRTDASQPRERTVSTREKSEPKPVANTNVEDNVKPQRVQTVRKPRQAKPST